MLTTRTHAIPIRIGQSVQTVEIDILPGLRLPSTVDSRRVKILAPAIWESVTIPIQAMEQLMTWWLNHGPIPSEEITRMRDKESDIPK